jgi:CO/xanthine dehydrogenase FAD-binding subunit
MIIEYHQPATLAEALRLLQRTAPRTIPVGGGTSVVHRKDDVAVVDLKHLGWDYLQVGSDSIRAGSMVKVRQLESIKGFSSWLPVEGPRHLQNTATLGGALMRADGRSVLATALLAFDAAMVWEPGEVALRLGDWFPQREAFMQAKLIKEISWNPKVRFGMDFIGRSPQDTPMLIVAMARWSSGRTRIVVGGFGNVPKLAMDGPSTNGVEAAVENALSDSADQWASEEYRIAAGKVLARRLMAELE